MITDGARWPAKFDSDRAPIHVINELGVKRSATGTWADLIRVADWPRPYANASKVKMANGGGDLADGARFTWRTFGVDLSSQVEDFVHFERLAWGAKGPGVSAYHAGLITPTAKGCTVRTEETQHSFACRAATLFFPVRVELWHQRWLDSLAARSNAA